MPRVTANATNSQFFGQTTSCSETTARLCVCAHSVQFSTQCKRNFMWKHTKKWQKDAKGLKAFYNSGAFRFQVNYAPLTASSSSASKGLVLCLDQQLSTQKLTTGASTLFPAFSAFNFSTSVLGLQCSEFSRARLQISKVPPSPQSPPFPPFPRPKPS